MENLLALRQARTKKKEDLPRTKFPVKAEKLGAARREKCKKPDSAQEEFGIWMDASKDRGKRGSGEENTVNYGEPSKGQRSEYQFGFGWGVVQL